MSFYYTGTLSDFCESRGSIITTQVGERFGSRNRPRRSPLWSSFSKHYRSRIPRQWPRLRIGERYGCTCSDVLEALLTYTPWSPWPQAVKTLIKKYLTHKLAVSLRRKKSQCDRVPRISKPSRWLETVFDVSPMMGDLDLHDSSNYRQAP